MQKDEIISLNILLPITGNSKKYIQFLRFDCSIILNRIPCAIEKIIPVSYIGKLWLYPGYSCQ